MNKCYHCQKNTKNPKFCSRSCSAIWTNTNCPKRKKIRYDKQCHCGAKIQFRSVKCAKCCNFLGDMTLKEAIYQKHHKSSAYALVRSRARMEVKKYNKRLSCESCGYDKHVEIAHIKAVSTFSEDTMISEINSKENLKVLCPNCHWEFDHLSIFPTRKKTKYKR